MSKIIDPKIFAGEVNHFKENISCTSCGKEYSITVKSDDKDYCMTCFGRIFGLNEVLRILAKMDKTVKYFWETPTIETSEEMKAKVNWVKKK